MLCLFKGLNGRIKNRLQNIVEHSLVKDVDLVIAAAFNIESNLEVASQQRDDRGLGARALPCPCPIEIYAWASCCRLPQLCKHYSVSACKLFHVVWRAAPHGNSRVCQTDGNLDVSDASRSSCTLILLPTNVICCCSHTICKHFPLHGSLHQHFPYKQHAFQRQFAAHANALTLSCL